MLERKKVSRNLKLPLCPVCGNEFKYRVKRSGVIKVLFFWYPVKRYFCAECLERYHIYKPQYAR
jgi:hypothetical protein